MPNEDRMIKSSKNEKKKKKMKINSIFKTKIAICSMCKFLSISLLLMVRLRRSTYKIESNVEAIGRAKRT